MGLSHKSDVERYWGCHLPVMGREIARCCAFMSRNTRFGKQFLVWGGEGSRRLSLTCNGERAVCCHIPVMGRVLGVVTQK